LRAGDTAEVIRYLDAVWLYGRGRGKTGYILRAKGNISTAAPPPPPDTQSNLLYIKGYFEVYGMSNPEYRGVLLGKESVYAGIYGLPAAIKMYNTKQVDISPDTQTRRLWFDLFTASAPPMTPATIEKRFNGLLKDGVCYSDHAGNTGFNQIITANNMAYSMINSYDRKRNKEDVYHPIRCLKVGSYNFMRDQIIKNPYLISNATISTHFDEGRGVIPFWHLDGNTVPVPQFCTDEVNWINEKWIMPVNDYVNGYYPPR
jgi:hypothetical protein